MEGDAGRGFERLLRRLDAATRARHCGAALEDALRAVLAQVALCSQAMDHARQVDEATKSLIANAAAGARVWLGSPAIAQHLTELQELATALQAMVHTLAETVWEPPAIETVAETVAEPSVKIEQEMETFREEETLLLDNLRSLLAEQHGASWLSEALEVAKSVVRALRVEDAGNVGRDDFSAEEQRIFEPFKLLRKAVLKNVAAHPAEAVAFRKVLKRLGKKRPVFSVFVDRCEELLAEKQAKAAQKPKEEPSVAKGEPKKSKESSKKPTPSEVEASTSKSKKRKLAEARESTPAPVVPSALADVRSKAQLCAAKAQALGDVFALSAFDVCLKLMIDVVNALTPQFTGDDTAQVSATLFVLVDAVDKIKVLDKRRDRLVCLESLLSVLLTKERLSWDSARTKKTVQTRLTACREAIEELRRHELSAASNSTAATVASTSSVVKKKKKKVKPASSHKRFDEE